MTSLPEEIRNTICAINTWQTLRIQSAVRIAHDAIEYMTSADIAGIDFLSEELDRRLIDEILPEVHAQSDFDSTNGNILEPNDDGHSDGDTESMLNSSCTPSLSSLSVASSSQLSLTWSTNDVDGQALPIERKSIATYSCYKDMNYGVMACHGTELVYPDLIIRSNPQGSHYAMRIVMVKGDYPEQPQPLLRSIDFPSDLKSIRIVDLDYAFFMSKYIFAAITYQSNLRRESSLYCFNTKDDSFERWVSLADTKDGLISRMCCCVDKPIIYLIVNVFGEGRLLTMGSTGAINNRKSAHDLPLGVENARLVDVACTSNNHILAIAYNTTVNRFGRGQIGICLMDPINWVRMASLKLGSAVAEYTVPRLTWLNKLAMFVLVNHENDQLLTFNAEGKTLGWRSFFHFIEQYDEPYLRPVNVCAADTCDWIAIRYSRFINIHRVIP
jgi:hypothetical protein